VRQSSEDAVIKLLEASAYDDHVPLAARVAAYRLFARMSANRRIAGADITTQLPHGIRSVFDTNMSGFLCAQLVHLASGGFCQLRGDR
jgi:hypothetical protein